ncbi:hypothetical protein [Streptomyces sp. NPDC089919]|uniref:hypothetical protein n=1 Tax=Streptomyces sp. NPDC089919 TaxID=3155188 RepID=UPI00341A65FF
MSEPVPPHQPHHAPQHHQPHHPPHVPPATAPPAAGFGAAPAPFDPAAAQALDPTAPPAQAYAAPPAPPVYAAPPAPAGIPGPGAPFAPPTAPAPAARPSRPLLGILATLVTALATAGLYGWVIGLINHQIGFVAVLLGALIGVVAGRVGGPGRAAPLVAAVLAMASVYAGQLLGIAITNADQLGYSTMDVLELGLPTLNEAWTGTATAMDFVFFLIGGFTAFKVGRVAGRR